MMERRKFAHSSRLLFVGMTFWVACASPTTQNTVQAAQSESEKAASEDLIVEASTREAVNGGVVILTVRMPHKMSGPKAQVVGKMDEMEIPFYSLQPQEGGVFEGVVGIPFVQKPGAVKILIQAASESEKKDAELELNIVEGKYRSEVLTVDPKTVNPNPKDLARIKKESAEVGEIYRRVTLQKFWEGPFILPIQSPITSPFGTKRVYNGEMQNYHQGLDLKAKVGTPIKAPGSGVVVMAKRLFLTGNTVLLDHGYGIYTVYAHMSRLKVKKGKKLKKNQLIGLAGQTGRVSGPHLHWGAVIHRTKVDPLELTRVMK